MQILSLVWGVLSIAAAVVAFFPCLGALNWLVIPFAAIGLAVSLVAFAGAGTGSRRGAQAGIVLCAIATVMGAVRLLLGGGVL